MPVIRIAGVRPRTDSEVAALIDAVLDAQRDVLRVADEDRDVLYFEHPSAHARPPAGSTVNYVRVELVLYPGRSDAEIQDLFAAVVHRFEQIGIAASDTVIVLSEIPPRQWAFTPQASTVEPAPGSI